jgi:chemosensory pili system protein ChpA (sensor histidine kinase/response regulator)
MSKVETTEPLQIEQPQFVEVINKAGIETVKAHQHAQAFAPSMAEYSTLAANLATLDKTVPEHAKIARENRLKMVKVRTGAAGIKDARKANLLVEANLIQGLFNVVESTCKLTEADFESIEKYQEQLEADRKAKLAADRLELCLPYEIDTTYLPLAEMTDEQFERCLENGKLAFDARIAAAEKAEAYRIAAEQAAEAARIEAERLQAERIENERLEAERIKAEKEELERKFAEEQKRVDAENKRRDAELAAERKAAAELADKLAKENEAKIAEQAKIAAENLAAQKAIADKAAAELKAKQDAEAKIAADKLAADKAALNANDKEKVRQLHTALKAIVVPEFTTKEGKEIGNTMREALDILIKGLVSDSKKLL